MDTEYDDIKSRLTLSTLVLQYVQIKKYGDGKWKGLCPFHLEKTPSFYVDDNHGSFNCFGCSVRGDIVDFTEKIEAISHTEAVKRLKHEAGIEDHFMTKSQKRDYEVFQRKRMETIKSFRRWRQKIIDDLISYTNAQWKIYRTANRQSRITPTEELEEQIRSSLSEASSREEALSKFEEMKEVECLEWYNSISSWLGVKNPRWLLSGWRKDLVNGANK